MNDQYPPPSRPAHLRAHAPRPDTKDNRETGYDLLDDEQVYEQRMPTSTRRYRPTSTSEQQGHTRAVGRQGRGGRGAACDIALGNLTVSRRHARLLFRDGAWVVHDLASRNGLTVNGARVGRCQLRPGDRLGFGLQLVEID